jgi:hypothetical protein
MTGAEGHRLFAVLGLGHHLEAGFLLQGRAQSVANHPVIVGQQYAYGHGLSLLYFFIPRPSPGGAAG